MLITLIHAKFMNEDLKDALFKKAVWVLVRCSRRRTLVIEKLYLNKRNIFVTVNNRVLGSPRKVRKIFNQ